MIDDEYNIGNGYFKVLEHAWGYTRIYCIIDNEHSQYAVEILINHADGKIVNERTIWATRGNADEAVWPYWWNYIQY